MTRGVGLPGGRMFSRCATVGADKDTLSCFMKSATFCEVTTNIFCWVSKWGWPYFVMLPIFCVVGCILRD